METYASPFIKTAIGIAIILISIGAALLFATPFINAIRWW